MDTLNFSKWIAEQEQEMNALQQKKANNAVAKGINSMPADQAMGAIKGTDQQAQKKLVAKALAGKSHIKGINDIVPVVGIEKKLFMRKK